MRFIRYVPENKPQVEAVTEGDTAALRITVAEPILGHRLAMDADYLVLAAAMVPSAGSKEIAQLFKVALGVDGFFQEAHAKLRPVDFGADGVYLCGTAHYPKLLAETISQSYGAAGRVLTLLANDTVVASGSVCEVNEDICMGCGLCVSACTYGAVELHKTKKGSKAAVIPVLCKGDGLCNAKCPTGAIQLKHYTDEALLSQIRAGLHQDIILDQFQTIGDIIEPGSCSQVHKTPS